jgi:MFS family permease
MSVTTEADPVSAHESSPSQTAKIVPLRRNVNFQLLWAGSSAAFIGIQVADIAYPLVILAMTHSPFKAGLFATVQLIGMMAATLPAGQLLDKQDRRRVLMAAELVRAVAGAGVALAWYLGSLTFWQLMGTALILGAAMPFGAARTLMTRMVVPQEQLTTALTQEQVRDHGSQLVGPALGGALYAVSRALPFVVAAAMMVMSFMCAFFVKLPPKAAPSTADVAASDAAGEAAEAAAETPKTPATDPSAFAGIKILFCNPVMRATTISRPARSASSSARCRPAACSAPCWSSPRTRRSGRAGC